MTPVLPIAVAVLGALVVIAGVAREATGLRGPVTDPATGGAYVRALRSLLGGGALITIGVGWATGTWAAVALGLIIGLEEMMEIGVVIAAMNDAERRPDSGWRFHRPARCPGPDGNGAAAGV